ncbi:MAG: ABC transporter permease [Candidatus Methanofastidiosia archaeon]
MDTPELVLSNIFKRKGRTLLTLFGIALGVAAIVTLVSISSGLRENAASITKELAGDVTVMDKKELYFGSLSEDVMREVEKIKGVRAVAPTVIVMDLSKGFGSAGSEADGVDPVREETFSSASWNIIDGRPFTKNDGYKALVGEAYAKQKNFRVGDKFNFVGKEFEVVGIISFGNPLADQNIYIPIDTAREMLGKPDDYINIIRVKVSKPGTEKGVARRIKLSISGVEAQTSQVLAQQIDDFLGIIESITWAISAVAAIVGGVGIANTMLMSVIERTREIGVLKAVGWSNADVMKVILAEGALLGFLGGILGISLGSITVYLIKYEIPTFAAEITLKLVLQAMSFALALGVFGSLYPARRASNLDPVEALKYE